MEQWVTDRDEHDERMKNESERKDLLDALNVTGRIFDSARVENRIPYDRLVRMNIEEQKAVSDSFTAAYNDVQKGIAESRAARFRKLDTQDVSVRRRPRTTSQSVQRFKYPVEVELDGYVYGEELRGNDLWFRKKGGGWIWSGMFASSNRSPEGLTRLPDPGPEPAEREQTVTHTALCDCKDCVGQYGTVSTRRKAIERHNQNHFVMEMQSAMSIARPKGFKKLKPILSPGGVIPMEKTEQLEFVAPDNPRRNQRPRPMGVVDPEQLEALIRVERECQANMAYRVGPHPWFGWQVVVDTATGGLWEFWRPSKTTAERTGHKHLEKQVLRRQRLWEAANPRIVTARDRWIVEPTQAEQNAKEQAEWDAQFHGTEGQK